MKNGAVLLKLAKLVLLLALVVLIPVAGMGLVYRLQPHAYGATYYAELPVKVDRLTRARGGRLVVIGGSSVAFGIDSKLAERELGMPCVNFGLYAAFGLKPMLDLAAGRLHRGDIVVISPETTSQMYSTYCGCDYLLQAFEARHDLLISLGADYVPGLIAKIPGYVRDAAALRKRGGAPESGVYALSSFDMWGDIVYPRPENVMQQGYITDNLPELTPDIVTDGFLDMINDFVRAARLRGAEVYFSFCPINALSAEACPEASRQAFVQALRDGLDCQILSPLSDHIMDAGYFYDSNYHLNDTGVKYNTLMLVMDVQRVTGRVGPISSALPHPPAIQRGDVVLSEGVEQGFAYEVTPLGAVVTGLDESLKNSAALDVPSTLGGAQVVTVKAGALAGCAAERITLPSTITRLPGRLFQGLDRLVSVTILSEALPEVGDELLSGARADIVIYVPETLYGLYITDYFWGAYAPQLRALS